MKITKNITKLASMLFLSLIMLVSCSHEDPITSTVTNYAILETIGANPMYLETGNAYVEPGVNATIAGESVPFDTLGTVDSSTPGFYTLTYQVINSDGFAATATRTVIVYENNGTLAGIYDGIRIGRSGGPILLSSTGTPDVYNCSDITAGHYEFDRGLGSAYATPAVLNVAGSSITSTGGNNAFGNWQLSGGNVSADLQTLTWTSTIPAFSFGFPCQLTKVTP